MKYVYSGTYREFRGYVFANGKAVDVTDRGTLELIKREPDFKEVADEKAQIEKAAPQPDPVLKGKECTKCHKLIPKGWYFHDKWCKG